MEKTGYSLKRIKGVFLFVLLFFTTASALAAPDLNKQIDILAKKLASAAQGDVLKGTETQVYISLGQRQGILPGNKFEIVRQGEPLKVGDEIIGYEETRVAEVEVARARDKISICKVLTKSDVPKAGDKAYQLRKKINTLVVGQFSYNQGFNRLTKSLQEKLVTAMANRGMQVVERDQLERVLKEQKLGYSGLVNMNSAKKIGELLGAEGMLLGTISDMGNAITINARMVDIGSGKAVSASEVELPKTPLIAQLLEIPVEDKLFTVQPSNSQPNLTKKNNKSLQSIEGGGISVSLKKCLRSGTNVKCKLMIKNNENDNRVSISNYSRLFDDVGNAYKIKNADIANRGWRNLVLVKDVPVKASVTFTKINTDAKYATLIELFIRIGNGRQNFQFRDVPFTRK